MCYMVKSVRACVRVSVRALPPYYPPSPLGEWGEWGGGREETVKDIVPSPDQQGSGFCELKPFLFLSFFNLGGCVSCLRACFGAG